MHNFYKEIYCMEKKDIWKRKINEWEKSSLNRTEFCLKNSIPVSTFDYWRMKIRKESAVEKEKGLVRIPVVLKASTGSPFSIEYPSGHKINIPSDYDSHSLIRLVADLKEILK